MTAAISMIFVMARAILQKLSATIHLGNVYFLDVKSLAKHFHLFSLMRIYAKKLLKSCSIQ